MDLSEQGITGRQFDVNRRGYDPDEVDAHLAEIASANAVREARLAELEATVAGLEAKVQDANETEEALRLTLKAAAHAKEELLANAREEAGTIVSEATANAEQVVATATAEAEEMTAAASARSEEMIGIAEARAAATETEARRSAVEVAEAAVAESEVLVGRIGELRALVNAAEEALNALRVEASPQVESARTTLDAAVEKAREAVENPDALFARAAEPAPAEPTAVQQATVQQAPDEPTTAEEPARVAFGVGPRDEPPEDAELDVASPGEDPSAFNVVTDTEAGQPDQQPPSESGAERSEPDVGAVVPDQVEPQPPDASDVESQDHRVEDEEQLAGDVGDTPEAVTEESTEEISDKVDRLLEELREVT